jgi:hypothetical protein
VKTAALLLLLASPYGGGKYDDDPRLARILARLPAQRTAARAFLARRLGLEVPEFEVRVEDAAGSTIHAETRLVGGKPVVVLKAEFLLLGMIDVSRTLVHEYFHCLHRTRIGETRYAKVPAWAREGAALYVAEQTEGRAEMLVSVVVRDPLVTEPLERLLDGLAGPHDLYDYFEDAAAFAALGPERGLALARALLDEADVARAVRTTTGKDVAALERGAHAYARTVLASLLRRGPLPADRAYAVAASEHEAGEHEVALARVRRLLKERTTLRPEARLLEVRILKALKSPDHARALARARKDLEPFADLHASLEERVDER